MFNADGMKTHTRSVTLFLSFALTAFAAAPAQISIVPGSAARGAELFREKSCIECHASAPQAPTPTLLAAALWNHSPKMWRAQQERNVRPMLDSIETADLFAYFFSLAYFTAPADPMRGALLFEQKSCSRCHFPTANNNHRIEKLHGVSSIRGAGSGFGVGDRKIFTDYDSCRRLASRAGHASLDAGKRSALAAIPAPARCRIRSPF